MNIDPTSDEATLRKQLQAAIEAADKATLRQIAAALSTLSSSDMLKEPQVPYEPEVPLILRKPSDEQLAKELNERASRNDSISSEEVFERLIKEFG